jgi:hypothetical protein
MSRKPIEIPERPRLRQGSPASRPAEQRQHRGLIFSDGRAMTGGRAHFARPDHFDSVGVSSCAKTPLFIANSTFKATRPLPSTVSDSPRRRSDSPSQAVRPSGRKYIAPNSSGNIVEHSSGRATPTFITPSRTPTRTVSTPRDNLGISNMAPSVTESPSRGRRVTGGPPPFVPEPFKPRSYSPQLRKVDRVENSGDILGFDPTNRSTTPSRAGRRVIAPVRTYDVITGQQL